MADDWQRLAAMVRERRVDDLGLSQEEVSRRGGPSMTTQRNVEAVRQSYYRPVILRRLEQALDWEPGSVRAILAGGDPAPVPPPVTGTGTGTGTAAAAGAATATGTALPAAGPGNLIGQTIAEKMFLAIEAAVWDDINDARDRGAGEDAIFPAEPAEQALWNTPLRPEEQRAADIAYLRAFRRSRPPRRNSTQATLAG